MNYVVKLVLLAQCGKFQLASPYTILLHVSQILVYRFIILNERSEIVFILFNVINSICTVLLVRLFIAFKLVSYGSEQAISISTHFYNFESVLA